MLAIHRRTQNIFLPLSIAASLAAGTLAALVWDGWFLLWWQRTLAFLGFVAFGAISVSALGRLLQARRQIKNLLAVATANDTGPTATGLHTPSSEAGKDDLGGFDLFSGRRHGP